MAFPFRMTFTGICAFVPNINATEGTVLLVSAGIATGKRDAHYPWLRYRGQKYDLTKSEVTLSLTNPQPAVLQIFSPALPAPTPLKAQIPTVATDEERSIFWIADMAAAGATLNPNCFSPTRPTFVTSRIKLNSGSISTSRMLEDRKFQGAVTDLEWALIDPNSGNSAPQFNDRAMAGEFSLNVLIDGGQILIQGASSTTSLTLSPAAGEACVDIGNTCDCVDDQGPLDDFGWFFDLANSTTIFLPTRTGGGVTDTMCPPARFAPNPNA
jgi:hypothetical protein